MKKSSKLTASDVYSNFFGIVDITRLMMVNKLSFITIEKLFNALILVFITNFTLFFERKQYSSQKISTILNLYR